MARTSEKVGRGPCPGCGERVTFHRTRSGLLNYECDACDHSGYAFKNGAKEKQWLASIEKPEGSAPPTPDPSPTPTPAPRRSSGLLLS